jgi:hypothetical protein
MMMTTKNILNNQPMMVAVCRQGEDAMGNRGVGGEGEDGGGGEGGSTTKLKPMGDVVREAK